MKTGDYIIGIETIRGFCKKGTRYKILGISEKGYIIDFGAFGSITLKEDHYYILHNNKCCLSKSSSFKYDYEYNRKLKLRKLKKIK